MEHRLFRREGVEYGRGIGFFDAIYGFAITLLVANIDPPPAEAWQSLDTLMDSGLEDQLVGFFISFVVIAVFWKGNSALLSQFRGLDDSVITMNLLSAGLVVLLPFTTQGISESSLAELPLPVALYAANVAAALLAQHAVFETGRVRRLLDHEPSARELRAVRIDLLVQVCVFVLSVPIAYLASPEWARLSWLLLVPLSIVTGRRVARARADGGLGEEANVQPSSP